MADDFIKEFMLGSKQEQLKELNSALPKAQPIKSEALQAQIESKRAELELKRLDAELNKLAAPDTRLDYWDKLLSLQQQNFNQQLQMQEKQMQLQLEIERLKLGDGGEDWLGTFLDMLQPYVPQIIASLNKKSLPPTEGQKEAAADAATARQPPASPKEKRGREGAKMDALEAYKQAIREGKISEEQAYKDFCAEMPVYAKLITKEQFSLEFAKIKNGKA